MMQEIYCTKCERKINNIPFVGEKFVKFKDGIYCQKCAEVKVKEMREKK
jgi:hypothetical protein